MSDDLHRFVTKVTNEENKVYVKAMQGVVVCAFPLIMDISNDRNPKFHVVFPCAVLNSLFTSLNSLFLTGPARSPCVLSFGDRSFVLASTIFVGEVLGVASEFSQSISPAHEDGVVEFEFAEPQLEGDDMDKFWDVGSKGF